MNNGVIATAAHCEYIGFLVSWLRGRWARPDTAMPRWERKGARVILIKLEDMMWRRRIRSVSRLARLAGLSRQTVDALYNRPNRVKGFRLETLDGLCRALDCRIEDLIEYVPETDPELPHRTEGTGEVKTDSGRADVVAAGPTPEDAQPVPPSQ